MYLLLKERYSAETGRHYYEEYERINNEEVVNYLFYKYSKNTDFCIIKVGFLTNEYIETLCGEYIGVQHIHRNGTILNF